MEKRKRPRTTEGPTYRKRTGCGNLYVRLGNDKEGLLELFATLGKSGCCAYAQLEALTRAITLGLRYGIPPKEFVDELDGIKCPSHCWDDGEEILSCADAIAKVLKSECRNNKPD